MAPWNRKCRKIEKEFENHVFKPKAVPMSKLELIELGHDEMEALRLVDLQHLRQTDAADQMGISSATIQRIIEAAREKVVRALIEGQAISIKGGTYQLKE